MERVDKNKAVPRHIAVIMDGNGRWAKKRGAARIFGHKNAISAVRDTVEGCAEVGVNHLTLFAFSTENWGRPQTEVNALMQLLVSTIKSEIKTLHENNVRLSAIGDLQKLPQKCSSELATAIEQTKQNSGLNLILALNYSGKWDLIQANKKMLKSLQAGELSTDEIDDRTFETFLSTADVPDPELLIRTSGEYRISNFMLWQLAYTEIFITETLWPDFRKNDLENAIIDFQKRERRFGKVLSE